MDNQGVAGELLKIAKSLMAMDEVTQKYFDFVESEMRPFIYTDGKGNAVNKISSHIMWLGDFSVEAYNRKQAEQLAFRELEKKYPQYAGQYWLF